MTAKIIRKRQIREHVEYYLSFAYGNDGCGFNFPCDSEGKVDLTDLSEAALSNYWMCVVDKKIEEGAWVPADPAFEDGTYFDGRLFKWSPSGRTLPIINEGVQKYVNRIVEHALIECGSCGKAHALANENGMGDSQCECGQWYNACGQQLADPCEWGEDTHERFDSRGFYVGPTW